LSKASHVVKLASDARAYNNTTVTDHEKPETEDSKRLQSMNREQ